MKLKTNKIIYHTPTQEDFDDLMIKLAEQDFEPLKSYFFQSYKERTCVRSGKDNRLVYGGLDFYKKDFVCADYEIVKYKANPKDSPYKVKLKANQQFLANWYEENKDEFDYNLWDLIRHGSNKVYQYISNEDDVIAMLVNMHQFGYEIEKEPRYIVKLPNLTNYNNNPQVICKNENSDNYFACGEYENHIHKFTEKEIKENIEWAWQFAKEVE